MFEEAQATLPEGGGDLLVRSADLELDQDLARDKGRGAGFRVPWWKQLSVTKEGSKASDAKQR